MFVGECEMIHSHHPEDGGNGTVLGLMQYPALSIKRFQAPELFLANVEIFRCASIPCQSPRLDNRSPPHLGKNDSRGFNWHGRA